MGKSAAGDVDQFLQDLQHPLKAELEAVRAILLGASPSIAEGIKWNAPSFRVSEYFATFHLRSRDAVQIIFHLGAKVKPRKEAPPVTDPAGLLEWLAKDRATVKLRDMTEIRTKSAALADITRQWITHLG